MTLAFSEQINNRPTYFPEKIWDGLLDKKLAQGIDYVEYDQAFKKQLKRTWDIPETGSINPKLHTIREDSSNRWRAGMDIHMVINNRTKNRFQFAPVVKCVSVQEIEIRWGFGWPQVTIDNKVYFEALTKGYEVISRLAINDGFDSVEDFFAYFNKDFKGRLIHWSDLKY